MKPATILIMSVLALALTACSGSATTGVRADPLPPVVAAECAAPGVLVFGGTVADDFVSMRRLGDALIECEAARAVAVAAYGKLRDALASE